MKIKYKKLILLLNITINHISLCSGQESSPGSLLTNLIAIPTVPTVFSTVVKGQSTQEEMKPEEEEKRFKEFILKRTRTLDGLAQFIQDQETELNKQLNKLIQEPNPLQQQEQSIPIE